MLVFERNTQFSVNLVTSGVFRQIHKENLAHNSCRGLPLVTVIIWRPPLCMYYRKVHLCICMIGRPLYNHCDQREPSHKIWRKLLWCLKNSETVKLYWKLCYNYNRECCIFPRHKRNWSAYLEWTTYGSTKSRPSSCWWCGDARHEWCKQSSSCWRQSFRKLEREKRFN